MSIRRDIRFRVYIVFSFIVIFAFAIIAKVMLIQVKEGDSLQAMAQKTHTKAEVLLPERGNIYSEDGTLLSATIPQFDLRIDFKAMNKDTFIYHLDSIATGLSLIFNDASAHQYKNRLNAAFRRGDRYWLLKKRTPYYQYQLVRQLPVFNKGKNKGGFIAEPKSKRVNPYGMLAYRTIGLWRENSPSIGLEQKFDSVLSGKPGSRIIRKTTGNVWIPFEGSEIDPVNGLDIVTTIDINIQDVTEHALLEILEKYKCQYGTAIVMEVSTGKIRALANLGRQKDGTYWEDFNYAMIPSEPGSTFKLMSLYALLEDGYKTIDDYVDVQGGVAYFGRQRVIDDHTGMGKVTLKTAFAKSSNVAFAKTISEYYSKNPMKYIRHLQKMHLHERVGIELTGERAPMIKTTKSKNWNKVTSLPWIAYGYESLITPLHTCMVYNAIANNGKMMKPYLVTAIREYGKEIKHFQPIVLEEKLGKQSTIAQIQKSLYAVVEEGTGKSLKSPFYSAAGKTGTAQVADKGISYRDGVRQGSFVGYFPYDNPKYTIAVMVRSTPHGAYYGAVVGAPVFKKIADKLYASQVGGWRIDKVTDSIQTAKLVTKTGMKEHISNVLQTLSIKVVDRNSLSGYASVETDEQGRYYFKTTELDVVTVPDVNGFGLKDALYILENAGMYVTVSGKGKVKLQSIVPGSKFYKGQKIHLELG